MCRQPTCCRPTYNTCSAVKDCNVQVEIRKHGSRCYTFFTGYAWWRCPQLNCWRMLPIRRRLQVCRSCCSLLPRSHDRGDVFAGQSGKEPPAVAPGLQEALCNSLQQADGGSRSLSLSGRPPDTKLKNFWLGNYEAHLVRSLNHWNLIVSSWAALVVMLWPYVSFSCQITLH